MQRQQCDLIQQQPVFRFFYKGSHSHPVRRTVLVFKKNRHYITGYEVRNGNEVCSFENAPVKRYVLGKIARYGQDMKLRRSKINKSRNPQESTLVRSGLREYFRNGA